jgi:hypothetical protein
MDKRPIHADNSTSHPSSLDKQLEELDIAFEGKVNLELRQDLLNKDGAAILLEKLPQIFPPNTIRVENDIRVWEYVGNFYRLTQRFHEALSIYSALYDHMLIAQDTHHERIHKGTPLCWISDCYRNLGFRVHAKRYLMLTLCEDAISWQGNINPNDTGVYFRLVWGFGLSDAELKRYAKAIYERSKDDSFASRFPEWSLQQLDQGWMTEFPDPVEAASYRANTRYIGYLLSNLGDGTGQNLEFLAEYILSCMPGCRTSRRRRTPSSDHDIVCSMEGLDVDFRSELGRYFVCECKDLNQKAGFTEMAKFCRVLDSTKSRFGIMFATKGISGEGEALHAEREQLKVFQDRGIVIVAIDSNDLDEVAHGRNLVSLLRTKYETIRLDLLG